MNNKKETVATHILLRRGFNYFAALMLAAAIISFALGKRNLVEFFLIFFFSFGFGAFTNWMATYIKGCQKGAKREKKWFDIWSELKPAELRKLALAVFFIFATSGPLGFLMGNLTHEVSYIIVVLQTIFTGGLSASIILFGRRPLLLVLSMLICVGGLNLPRIPVSNPAPQITHVVNYPPNEIHLSAEQAESIQTQRMVLGFISTGSIVIGYVLFIFVLSSIGGKRIKYETEIRVAKQIQESILPPDTFHNGWINVAGVAVPADEVGGDFYDYFEINPEEVVVIVADASGHGVGPGIIAAMTKASLTSLFKVERDVTTILTKLNETLQETIETGKFLTLGLMVFSKKDNKVTIATAGHHPVLRLHNGELEEFRTPAPGLGISRKALYTEIVTDYCENDFYVLYTDGILDAENAAREQYGKDRFVEVIRRNSNMTPNDLAKAVTDSIKEYATGMIQKDDITFVAARIG